jgi:hypothetical protein
MGPFAPFLATFQALSRTRVFLLSENERNLLCMGRTFTVARTDLLHNCPFQLSFSWESNPARVKASERGAKCYPCGCYFSLTGFRLWRRFAPFLATIQALSRARAFLLG